VTDRTVHGPYGGAVHRHPRAEPLDANDVIEKGIYPMGYNYQVDCTDT
jgi:hypothetical protein